MDFRNRYLLATVRILLGLVLLFSGVSGFLMGPAPEGVPEPMATATKVLWDTGIFQMIKAIETIAGIMLLAGFLPWLAAILVAPIAVGIIVVNARLAPAYIAAGIVVALLTAYLGYAYWDRYRALFVRKR